MMSEKNLKLKVGAQIMLTKNDPNERWVNGTIGFVDKLEKGKSGFLNGTIYKSSQSSFFYLYGYLFSPFLSLIVLIYVIVLRLRR